MSARGPSAIAPVGRCILFALILIAWRPVASAQDGEVSAADQQAAAEAYDRGSSAYLARNYRQAAQYFETADRLAPSPAALMQAVRSHQRADNDLRAASLALHLRDRYPDDARAQRAADGVLSRAESRYVRVDVRCDGCSLIVDGAVVDHPSFFVEPDSDHSVTAHFETGDARETVTGAAGEQRELSFEAPPAPEPEVEPEVDPEVEPTDPTPVGPDGPPDGGGLPPALFLVSGVVTVGLAAATVWSGLDALDGVDAYEDDPTQDRLDEGQAKELRTNVLIGATAGFAALSVVLALLTDWGGSDEEEPPMVRASLGVLPGGGAAAVIEGALP